MGEWSGGVKSICPAVKELRDALLAAVPLLASNPSKLGTVRNDNSRHTAGLAMDIMLDSREPTEKSVADQIVDAVVAIHARMKWSDLIYTDWNGGKPSFFHIPGMPPFGGPKGMLKKNPTSAKLGEKHKDHIHIDWWTGNSTEWPARASTTGFKSALIAELQKPPAWLNNYMASSP